VEQLKKQIAKGKNPIAEVELQELKRTFDALEYMEEEELRELEDVLYFEKPVPTDPERLREWLFRAEARLDQLEYERSQNPQDEGRNLIRAWEIGVLQKALKRNPPTRGATDEEE